MCVTFAHPSSWCVTAASSEQKLGPNKKVKEQTATPPSHARPAAAFFFPAPPVCASLGKGSYPEPFASCHRKRK